MLLQTALKHIAATWLPLAVIAVSIVSEHQARAQGDKPVATINNEPITVAEFFSRLQRVKGSDFLIPTTPPAMRTETAGYIVLNSMINERLILQCAAKNNLTPTDAEINADLATVMKQDPVVRAISEHTVTPDEIKFDLTVQIARFNLATERKLATPEEVEKFYNDHIDGFRIPERWGLSAIRTKKVEDAVTVITELKAGKTFEETARLYSVDERSKSLGGRIGVADANDEKLPAEIRKAVAGLKVNEFTEPLGISFDAGDGNGKTLVYWVVKLTSRSNAITRQLADVREQVQRLATLQKAGGLEKADSKIADFRKSADVKVNLPGYEGLTAVVK